ncbi:MAG: TonB-dependent receptor plug domain-containing protein, partial [Bacteroidota bacterium]
MSRILLFLIVNSLFSLASAQNFTLSGYVKDSSSRETIAKAQITITVITKAYTPTELRSTTNGYGFYSITVPQGTHTVIVTAPYYGPITTSLQITNNLEYNFLMAPDVESMGAVTIRTKRNSNVKSLDISTQSINGQTIKKIPAFLGEADVIKSIQLLPGVTTVGEGASGFNVRGGSIDQNLVLMDEAPVFNSAHLFGFFSIFNPDALKDVELVKGGIPANYGGRLSSTLDVKSKDGNKRSYQANGGVGSIFSRLTLEGPLAKPESKNLLKPRKTPAKSSFMVSGRRSYIDILAKPFLPENLSGSQFYFYDLTAKANYSYKRDNIFISTYIGDDVFK